MYRPFNCFDVGSLAWCAPLWEELAAIIVLGVGTTPTNRKVAEAALLKGDWHSPGDELVTVDTARGRE
jgi:hypothetical protein